jgi:hypothetical protein
VTGALVLAEPPTGGKATLLGIPATGAQSVANLTAFAEQTLRNKVLCEAGIQVNRGWAYVAPQCGAV